MGIDIQSILYDYDRQNKEKTDDDETRAEDLISATTDDPALRRAVQLASAGETKDMREEILEKLENYKEHRDNELGEHSYDIDNPDVQKRLAETLLNSLNVKNVQKVILINNRENIRKGLTREVTTAGYVKGAMKGQTSTITIPTQLLRYVQQEIGGLSTRMTQNDLMTGFLYWYFGRPEDVVFLSEETSNKMQEILDNLDLNASPAKFNRLNYNTSSAMLDKLDSVPEHLNLISSLMATNTRDSIEMKSKSDKMYIALCYNILNMLAFAPPIMPGEQPEDIDMLANGTVWDLMSGIDTAYDYFKTKNGRELYKSKMHKKVTNQFNYGASVSFEQVQTSSIDMPSMDYEENEGYDEYDDDDEYYEDYYGSDDGDYEDVDMSDFDDMYKYVPIVKDDMGGTSNVDDRTLEDRARESKLKKEMKQRRDALS